MFCFLNGQFGGLIVLGALVLLERLNPETDHSGSDSCQSSPNTKRSELPKNRLYAEWLVSCLD